MAGGWCRTDLAIAISLAVLFVLALLSPMARAPFPVNDDWTQAVAVRETLAASRIFYPAWLSAWSYPQIAYGVALSALLGFSYPLLRGTTIVLSLATVAAIYVILRRRGIGPFASAAGASLLLANPISLFFSFTFQTDIPALFFWTAAILLLDLGFTTPSLLALASAGAAVALSTLERQTGALLAAAAIAIAWKEGGISRIGKTLALASPLALGVAFVSYAMGRGWAAGEGGTHLLAVDWGLVAAIAGNLWQTALLLSLLVMPASVSLAAGNPGWFRRRGFLLSLAVATGAAAIGVLLGSPLGALGNTLTIYGLGPTVGMLQGEVTPVFGPTAVTIATFVAALSGATFAYACARAVMVRDFRHGAPLAMVLASAGYLAFVLVSHPFDRYLLPLYPAVAFVAALALDRLPRSRVAFAVSAAALLAFSLAGTSDAFAWRSALWRLADRVEVDGIPARSIEGGYERDGDRLYASTTRDPYSAPTPDWAPWYVRSLYPGHPMEIILGFSPLGGYGIMGSETSRGIFGTKTIYANAIRSGSLKGAGGDR